MEGKTKTLIGLLASHDNEEKNQELADVFCEAYKDLATRKILTNFCFVFTGGTYDRLIKGDQTNGSKTTKVLHRLDSKIVKFLRSECGLIRLPSTSKGGVIILASLITLRKLSILWPFFSPLTAHLLYPENIALLRLADLWHVKKIMNSGSVNEWVRNEAERDAMLNRQSVPLKLTFPGGEVEAKIEEVKKPESAENCIKYTKKPVPDLSSARQKGKLDETLENTVLALISHDAMKDRMLDFVVDYEHELRKFKCILATGTTGKLIQEAAPSLSEKVKKHHSGPKGGDIEIATEILLDGCHVVIFFVDPLHPHPHAEDIRVVFSACMIQNQVRMLSNEMQARDWMDRMIRGR